MIDPAPHRPSPLLTSVSFGLLVLAICACGTSEATGQADEEQPELGADVAAHEAEVSASNDMPSSAALAAVDWRRMKSDLDYLADDARGGRIPGSAGHDEARAYIIAELQRIGLEPFGDGAVYEQRYAQSGRGGRFQFDDSGNVIPSVSDTGINLVGVIRGSDPVLRDEYVVVLAHYDHIGVDERGQVFNGALDDAGGAVALLEVARIVLGEPLRPKRSTIFIWSDGEESGLEGARHWLAHAPVAQDDLVLAISADPLGRGTLPDFAPILLVGLEHSPELKEVIRETFAFAETDVAFLNRSIIPGFASDQDVFLDAGVPGAWLITPGMTFYHTVGDDPDTIDYDVLRNATRFLLRLVFRVGAAPGRFPFRPVAELAPSDLADGRPVVVGLLRSTLLTADERARGEAMLAEIDGVLQADSLDALSTSPLAFVVGMVAYVAFELPRSHPGPIPPPLPAD